MGVDADVEPHRRVEAGALLEEDVLQLVAERIGVFIGGEVGVLDAPVGDRVRHAVDHLLDRALALGRAEVAAEVLARDDVRGQGGPALRELEVLLLEDSLAVLVRDRGLAEVPLDRVIRMDVRSGEAPLDRQARPGGLLARLQLEVGALAGLRLRPVPRALAVGVAVAVPVGRAVRGLRGGGRGGDGASHGSCGPSVRYRPMEGLTDRAPCSNWAPPGGPAPSDAPRCRRRTL